LEKIRALEACCEGSPFSKAFRDFLEWVSWYTVTPLGSILRLALPSASQASEGGRVGVLLSPGVHTLERLTPTRARVLACAAALEGPCLKTDLAKVAEVSLSVVNGLVDSGALMPMALRPDDEGRDLDPERSSFTLTAIQAQALDQLRTRYRENPSRPVALEGVTGSGKTIVYFEKVADVLRAGKQALILVPEIALTSSFLRAFETRFGARPAIWHSTVSEGRRGRVYRAVAQGGARILIGTRSALFLPFADLGLIVVDEEHDSAYKQEDGVLYNARDMAYIRARMEKASLLLVSATLSLETRYNIAEERIAHVALPVRFEDRPLPEMAVIDVRNDTSVPERWISSPLQAALSEVLKKGEQALLFLNRRGYAPITLCRLCGHRFACPHCDSWLVEHRKRKVFLCHHCGHCEPRLESCASCGGVDGLTACGLGIERLTDEVRSLFPEARLLTLSADLAGQGQKLMEALGRITSGEVDVIIGTQLITKGHTFPHLTLVGVMDADGGLDRATDPRGGERLFQLLTQVAGRAGRGERPGRALLQTWQPENPIIKALVSGDSEAFYRSEWSVREQGQLPPFGRLVALIISSHERSAAETYARKVVQVGVRNKPDPIRILGPVEAPLARCQGRYRFRILVRADRSITLQDFLHQWSANMPHPPVHVRCSIDVDPYSFL
jgi:primosomal protein N' (replication factor Y)